MKYRIEIEKAAQKFILKQPRHEQLRLYKAINALPQGDILKMSGKHALYRLRVGTYRVIYSFDEGILLIRIVEVGNRGDVYK